MATSLVINIIANANDAKKAIGEVSKSVEGLGAQSSKMGTAMAAGAATAITALVGLGVSALNAAQESAKIGRETERVLRTTGAAAWESVDGIKALSSAISEKTGVDDEAIQSGANLLLTFTNVQNQVGEGNDIFDRATAAALDMSTALGTDMSGAAIQLGKALNDPVKGMTALSKAGVSFTQTQKDQVAALVASGDALGAQKIVLAEVEKEFKGAAEAAATPFDKLKVAVGNLEEDIGAHLIPPVTAAVNLLLNGLGPAVENTTEFFVEHGEAIKFLATVGLVGLAAAYGPVVVGQVAMVATGVVEFLATAAAKALFLGQSYLIVAQQQGVLTATSLALNEALAAAGPLIALAAVSAAIYGVFNALTATSEAGQKFIKSITENVKPGNFSQMEAALASLQAKSHETAKAHDEQAKSLGNVLVGVLDVLVPFHDVENSLADQTQLSKTLAEGTDEYKAALDKAKGSLLTYAETSVLAAHGIEGMGNANVAATGPMAGLNSEIDTTIAGLRAVADAKGIDPVTPGAVDRITALWERSKVLGSATLELTDAQKKFNDAAGDAKDKVDAYKSSLDALIGVHLSAAEAQTNLSQNSFKLAKTLAENQKVVTSTTEEGTLARLQQTAAIDENNKAVQDNVKQILDMANATFKESQQTEGSTVALGKANEVLVTQRDKLIATMVQFGYSEEAAKAYVDRLGLTPKNIDTQVRLDNGAAMAALDDTRRKALEVGGTYTAVMDINTAPAHKKLDDLMFAFRIAANEMRDRAFLGTGQSPPGRAAGGPVTAGNAFIVGERGPELFVPARSGQVIPNGQFGSTVINVNVAHTGLGVDSPRLQRDLVEALRRYERRNGRGTA